MARGLDLQNLVKQLSSAAERIAASPAELCTEVTATDLVIAAHGADGGHGQGLIGGPGTVALTVPAGQVGLRGRLAFP